MAQPDTGKPTIPMIVGLGNPGREYAATRHNLGWLALDELVKLSSMVGDFKKKFQGEFAKGKLGGKECIFLRPETYMNESGRSVQGAMAFFHVAPLELVVLHDELDLPFGEVRVKVGGGHAGHNGVRSLVQHVGTPEFVRVRMGVGRPPADFTGEVADYLLSNFNPVERAAAPDIVARAVSAVMKILADGLERAMNEVNTRPKRPNGEGGTGTSGSEGGKQAAQEPLAPPTARHGAGRLLAPGRTSPGPSSKRRLDIQWQLRWKRTSVQENTKPFTSYAKTSTRTAPTR